MGESALPTPVRIESATHDDATALAIGRDVAGVLRYHMSVLDRENRLESGAGDWMASFLSDPSHRERAVHESVMRTVQMAVDSRYHRILELLTSQGHMKTEDLANEAGITTLTLHERVSDLVSAGLVSKIPEADQVSVAPAGAAVVEWVQQAVGVAMRELGEAG